MTVTDADHKIRPLTTGLGLGQHRMKCPLCHHERQKNRHDKSLSVSVDADGVQWNCWHCGEQGGWMDDDGFDLFNKDLTFTELDPFSGSLDVHVPARPTARPASRPAIPSMTHVEYLVSRGISKEIAEKHTIEDEKYINGRHQVAVGFPYRGEDGTPTKWRAIEEKGFTQTGACRSFWLKETHAKGNSVLICEGEMDALAWLTADLEGVTVLSIPNGAPKQLSAGEPNNEADTKFRYLWDARDVLERAPRIYINTDADRPGDILKQELLRRIHNPNRFIVDLDVHKDAADALAAEGPARLKEYFEEAGRPPTKGIHRASEYIDDIMDQWAHGEAKKFKTGLASVDMYTSFAPGLVTVMTGFPGSGKSNFLDQVAVNLALEHGWKSLLVNQEKQPRRHIPELVQKIAHEPWRDLPRDVVEKSVHWISEHLLFMDRSDKAAPDSITGILEEASKVVMQEGIRLLVIDPYNYLSRGDDKSETEFVAFTMKSISDWAKQHDCHVVLVAHPQKPESRTAGTKFPPKGYDISGSAHFYNVTDLGITMHRTDEDENFLHVWKVRFDDLGQLGAIRIGFNPKLGIWYDLPNWKVVGDFDVECDFPPLAPQTPSTHEGTTP